MTYIVLIPIVLFGLGYWTPLPSDATLIRGGAMVSDMQEVDGGFVISGMLPTPCNQLRITDELDVYSVIKPGVRCVQTLTPFTVLYPMQE